MGISKMKGNSSIRNNNSNTIRMNSKTIKMIFSRSEKLRNTKMKWN